MKFNYKVKYNGKFYEPGEDVPMKKSTKEKVTDDKSTKDDKNEK